MRESGSRHITELIESINVFIIIKFLVLAQAGRPALYLALVRRHLEVTLEKGDIVQLAKVLVQIQVAWTRAGGGS